MKRPAFIQALLATLLVADLFAPHAFAQAPPAPSTTAPAARTGVTVLTEPSGAWVQYSSGLKVTGRSPLELPPEAIGRFRILVQAKGLVRTQGVFRIMAPGLPPEYLSEPNGMSASLFVHAMNFPGIPAISSDREIRGLGPLLAEAGAIFGAVYSHASYRDRLNEFGAYAADRAEDERRQRTYWINYGAAVWAASAIDYMIRPRYTVREMGPNQISIQVPEIARGSAMWRSLLVPGAGQEYAGHRVRGSAWLTAALMAGAAVVFANSSADHDQTQLDWAEAAIDSAGPSERPEKEKEAALQRNELQQSEDLRRGAVFAVAAIWAMNLIDVASMDIPKYPATPPRLSAAFPITPEGPAVALQYRF
ncbi:MAG TPA: hypothetical protein VFS09_06810 [Candidatus Eisenbacteria bacterium]|nr:hypothetical protein [Candidatus Eisenbacteria bacterium]